MRGQVSQCEPERGASNRQHDGKKDVRGLGLFITGDAFNQLEKCFTGHVTLSAWNRFTTSHGGLRVRVGDAAGLRLSCLASGGGTPASQPHQFEPPSLLVTEIVSVHSTEHLP
jgi:hypothetical protein